MMGRNGGKWLVHGLFKQSMTGGIPEIYWEVLEAWRWFLPKIDYDCEDLDMIKNLPLFLNEKLKHKHKTLYEHKFIEGYKTSKKTLCMM